MGEGKFEAVPCQGLREHVLTPPPASLRSRKIYIQSLQLILTAAPHAFKLNVRSRRDLLAVDLGKLALRGLLNRNPELDPKDVDYLLYGTVIQVCNACIQYLHSSRAIESSHPCVVFKSWDHLRLVSVSAYHTSSLG